MSKAAQWLYHRANPNDRGNSGAIARRIRQEQDVMVLHCETPSQSQAAAVFFPADAAAQEEIDQHNAEAERAQSWTKERNRRHAAQQHAKRMHAANPHGWWQEHAPDCWQLRTMFKDHLWSMESIDVLAEAWIDRSALEWVIAFGQDLRTTDLRLPFMEYSLDQIQHLAFTIARLVKANEAAPSEPEDDDASTPYTDWQDTGWPDEDCT